MTRNALTPLVICAALAGAAPASAAPASPQTPEQLTSSWAKVNICTPTELGARAQLAGDGSKSEMSVRFAAQWLSPDGWVPLEGAATSPWQSAGSAEYTWGQAGWTFHITVPEGFAYQLRATAELKWAGRPAETQVTDVCAVGG